MEAGVLVAGQAGLADTPISVNGQDDDHQSAGSDESVAKEDVEVCEIILEGDDCIKLQSNTWDLSTLVMEGIWLEDSRKNIS